jgi:hypothetical protein
MMRLPLIDDAKRETETSNRVASSTKAEVNRGPTARMLVRTRCRSGTSDGTTSESKGQSESLFLPSRPVERIIGRVGRLVVSPISENRPYITYLGNKDDSPGLVMFQSSLINALIGL